MVEDRERPGTRKTTADRVREWYAHRTPEAIEADARAGREFALELQRQVAGAPKVKDEVAARWEQPAAAAPRGRSAIETQGHRCVRCGRAMPTAGAIGGKS